MNIVPEHLPQPFAKQVADRATAVWHDAETALYSAADKHILPETMFFQFEDNRVNSRAANPHLESELNDGVVLNIAPLWELVPWKEARKYWDELMEGKYEWSSIGKQLREKGLVK